MISSTEVLKCRHGISSYFYPVSDEQGIKFFKNKSERDRSYLKQEIAYHAGLAPKVGKIINIQGFFGYYTQRVQMIHDIYTFDNLPNKIIKKMNELEIELINSCDFEIDLNWQNYGLIGNNLVCVDFGD